MKEFEQRAQAWLDGDFDQETKMKIMQLRNEEPCKTCPDTEVRFSELERAVAERDAANAALEQSLDTANARIIEKNQSLEAANLQIAGLEQKLTDEAARFEELKTGLEQRLEAALAGNVALQQGLDDAAVRIESLKQDLKKEDSKYEALQGRLADAVKTNTVFEKRLSDANSRISELGKFKEDMQSKYEEYIELRDLYSGKVKAFEAGLKEQQQENEKQIREFTRSYNGYLNQIRSYLDELEKAAEQAGNKLRKH